MKELKRTVMWLALVVIVLLTVLSIYGAFKGTENAQAFFNSVPLAVYWVFFALLLIVSLFLFPRLIRVPGLLLIHLGCVAILAGGLWGSDAGHKLQKKLLGRVKMPSGRIVVYEGLSENRVVDDKIQSASAIDPNNNVIIYEFDDHGHPMILADDDPRILHLPFEIHLKDFRMEYYDPPRLLVDTADGKSWELKPLEADASFQLDGRASLKILGTYKNFKIDMDRGAFDDPHPGSNPAVQILITYPDGTEHKQYVFEMYPGHSGKSKEFTLRYVTQSMIKDYFSDLQVFEDGKVMLEKTIEVNHPLYYGGYHFYQLNYDQKAGQYSRYTVLSVTSDSGLVLVFAGFALMCGGTVYHLWLRRIMAYFKTVNQRTAHGD